MGQDAFVTVLQGSCNSYEFGSDKPQGVGGRCYSAHKPTGTFRGNANWTDLQVLYYLVGVPDPWRVRTAQ